MKTSYKLLLMPIILIGFSIKIKAQKNCTGYEELNRKRHKIDGGTYGHPYTTFDRKNGLTFEQTIVRIRLNIIDDKGNVTRPVYETYQTLYNSANTSINTNNDDGLINTTSGSNNYSQMAQWAKNNAFVFLIGLDGNGNYLDSTDPTGATRNAFKNRALQGLKNLTYSFSFFTTIFYLT
ncbi:MAG: hypothetical protein ACK5XN_01095 [Bacteroidota bacterium]